MATFLQFVDQFQADIIANQSSSNSSDEKNKRKNSDNNECTTIEQLSNSISNSNTNIYRPVPVDSDKRDTELVSKQSD